MSKWTHVRVSAATKAALDAEIKRLCEAHARGAEVGPAMSDNNRLAGGGISHDALIAWLLRYRNRQRKRSKKSRAKPKPQ